MRIWKQGIYKDEGGAHYTEGVKDKALTKTNGGYSVSLVW